MVLAVAVACNCVALRNSSRSFGFSYVALDQSLSHSNLGGLRYTGH